MKEVRGDPKKEEGGATVWGKVRIPVVSIFTMIFAIVSISVFFGSIPSDGSFGDSLPVTLVYVKSATDFLGRVGTLFPLCITSSRFLGSVVAVRFVSYL